MNNAPKKEKTPAPTKTLSEKIEEFLTPEGAIVAVVVLIGAGTVAYVIGKFVWLCLSKLFGLH